MESHQLFAFIFKHKSCKIYGICEKHAAMRSTTERLKDVPGIVVRCYKQSSDVSLSVPKSRSEHSVSGGERGSFRGIINPQQKRSQGTKHNTSQSNTTHDRTTMTKIQPIPGAPNEIMMTTIDENCIQTKKKKKKKHKHKHKNRHRAIESTSEKDDCDEFTDKTMSMHTTCTNLSEPDTSLKKSVSFEITASQLTVRNLKYDLSRKERKDIWYTGRDLDEFYFDYQKELNQERWLEEQREKERLRKEQQQQARNARRGPGKTFRKIFCRAKRKETATMNPAA